MSLLETLFSQGTIERLGWMLVHFLWQATAVALLLAASLKLLRRTVANLRYAVACGAMALMVVLPLITMQIVEVPGPVAEAGAPPEVPPPAIVEPLPVAVQMVDELPPLSSMPPLETADLATPIPWQERVAATLEPALPYLVLGWLAGVFGLSAWHLGGWTQLHRLKRRMTCQTDASLHTTLDELATRLGVRRAVMLLESAVVDVPTVVGWLRPVILLPASALTGLSPDQLRAILAHELAHIRRYDYLANILQTVVEILGFYHPAVWWVSTRIRIERENCCDDLAVQICGNSLQYARALTSMEEIRHNPNDLALAASGGSLMARIARLLGRPAVDDRRFAWLPGLIALLLVAGLVIPAAMVLATPNAPPTVDRVDSESNNSGRVRDISVVQAPMQAHAGEEQEVPAQVRVAITYATVLVDAPLNRETMLLMRSILATEHPQRIKEIAADPRREMTLGEVLSDSVTQKNLAPATMEALMELLRSRGYMKMLATPVLSLGDNEQGTLSLSDLVQVTEDPTQQPRHVEVGNRIHLKPHLSPTTDNSILMEFTVEVRDLVRTESDGKIRGATLQLQPGDHLAVRHTEIRSTQRLLNDHFFAILTDHGSIRHHSTENPASLLILFKPKIIQPVSATTNGSVTQILPGEKLPRQVLVVARTVAIDSGEVAALGIEWPKVPGYGASAPHLSPVSGTEVGYAPDRGATDSLLAAIARLQEQNRAEILSNQQIVALHGRQSCIRAVTEEWFSPPAPSQAKPIIIDSETVLAVTPRIWDSNNITLEIAVEASNSIPRSADSDLPIVTRRQSKNSVTIQDGGTIAIAGLAEKPLGSGAPSARNVMIFVTATLLPTTSQTAPSGQKQNGNSTISRVEPGRLAGKVASHEPPASPQNSTAAGQSGLSETRYLRLSHHTAQRVRDLLPPACQQYVHLGARGVSDPNDSHHVLTVAAPAAVAGRIVDTIRRFDARPRQMLLDARVVEIERADMLNLGIEWSHPTDGADQTAVEGDRSKKIQIGFLPDRTSTDSAMARLNRLMATKRARCVDNPQLISQDGRESRLRTFQEWANWDEEYARERALAQKEFQKVLSGTSLLVTPHVGDSNKITLEVGVEFSESLPKDPPADRSKGMPPDLPIVTHRQARNTVTIRNGGTVVIAGLATNPAQQNRRSTKEIVILATAALLPEARPLPPPWPARSPLLPAGMPIPNEPHGRVSPTGTDASSQQVLLSAHTVAIEQRQRRELPVQWTDQVLTLLPAASDNLRQGPFSRVHVGFARDQRTTDSVMAALRQLERDNLAEFMPSDQVLGQTGKHSQVSVRADEWYLMGQGHSDTALWVKPYIADNNDVRLDVAIEIRDSVDQSGSSQIAAVRRAPPRTFVLRNGGTLALVDVTEEDGKPSARVPIPGLRQRSRGSRREVVIFLTVRRIPADENIRPDGV